MNNQKDTSPASDSAEIADSSPTSDDGLIFQWKGRNKALYHMSVFMIMALVLHIGGFYFFQVVYPTGAKIEPVPDSIMILDNSDPAVHAMMGWVRDRVVFLRPASEGTGVRAELEDYSIQFQPSFSHRKPDLKLEFPAKALGLTAGESEAEEPETKDEPEAGE